jgi:hypothetical protein
MKRSDISTIELLRAAQYGLKGINSSRPERTTTCKVVGALGEVAERADKNDSANFAYDTRRAMSYIQTFWCDNTAAARRANISLALTTIQALIVRFTMSESLHFF